MAKLCKPPITKQTIETFLKKKKKNSEIHFKRTLYLGLPQWLSGKESACSAGVTGDTCSIPGSGDPLEEGVATHSSIPAREAPWTEEPGRLQPIGSQSWTRMSTLNCTGDPQGGLLKYRLLSPTSGVWLGRSAESPTVYISNNLPADGPQSKLGDPLTRLFVVVQSLRHVWLFCNPKDRTARPLCP